MRTSMTAKFKVWKRTSVYSTLTHGILATVDHALRTTIVFTTDVTLATFLCWEHCLYARKAKPCEIEYIHERWTVVDGKRFLSPPGSRKPHSGRCSVLAPSQNSEYPLTFSPRSLLKKNSCHKYLLVFLTVPLFSYRFVLKTCRLCILCNFFKVVHRATWLAIFLHVKIILRAPFYTAHARLKNHN